MADRSGDAQSQLYLLWIWTTVGVDGTPNWQGKLQPLLSAHGYPFASMPELWALLHTLLATDITLGPGNTPSAQAPGAET